MASLTFEALWRDRGVAKGLQTLATEALKAKRGFDKLGSSDGVFKRLGASSAQAARAGGSIGMGLQRGITKPLLGLPGIIAGLVGGAVVVGAKKLATEASDMNETVSKTRTIFGASSKAIESWAKGAARDLGMSRQEALTGAAAFGNLFDQLGFGAGQATKMSKGFVRMATDAASFNNANPAEVMDAFQAATRGEYDALQKYIPTASAATIEAEAMRMTHKKSKTDLTAADKAAALYQVSVKGLGKAHGDFARTSGGFANQQRIMAANWADLRVKIGTYFLPIFVKASKYMNDEGFPALTRIVEVLGSVGGAAGRMGKAVVSAFSGEFEGAIDGATTNLTEIADWMETHQTSMVKFFLKLGHGAIDFGRTLTALAAGGIRAFGNMAGGLADFIDGAIPGIQGVMNGFAELVQLLGDNDVADSIRTASNKLGEGGRNAAAGLRDTKARAEEAATAVEKRMNPVFDAAEAKLNKVGEAEIWKAKQRDAAAKAAIAIRDIGTNADGSQIKLKKWSDISKLGADRQKALRDRITDARTGLRDQLGAMRDAGVGQDKLSKAWKTGKDRLYEEFRQMGLSKTEAKRLATQYAGIKPKVETKVTQPGMKKAREDAKGLDDDINDLNSKSVRVKVTYSASGTINIGKGRPKTPARDSNSTLGGNTRAGALGTVLPGWSPGRDIHEFLSPTGGRLLLSGGEAVMRPEWTKAVGGPRAVAQMNADAIHGKTQAHAGGGVFRVITVQGDSDNPPNVGRRYRLAVDDAGDRGAALARAEGRRLARAEVARQKAAIAKAAAAAAGGGDPGGPAVGGGRNRVNWKGGTFTERFRNTLIRAQRLAGRNIPVFQGGFSSRVSASGRSHLGDAIDTSSDSAILSGLRRARVAAWKRTPAQGFIHHIHGVPLPGAGFAGGSGVWQAQDYLRGGNGLAAGAVVKGGKGGVLTRVGEGRRDELVAPLPRNWENLVRVIERGGARGGGKTELHFHFDRFVGSPNDLKREMVAMYRRGDLDVIVGRR